MGCLEGGGGEGREVMRGGVGVGDGWLEGEDTVLVSERWGVLGGGGGLGGFCERGLIEWGLKSGGSGWLAV